MKEVWTRPYPPFRMAGPIYWVGSYDLASYLITGSEGHILINSGVEPEADLIEERISTLGFDLADVAILTGTHGHYDHIAAMADLKRRSGARLIVDERDRPLYESGGRADFRWCSATDARFPPVIVDADFGDNPAIVIGNLSLSAHRHAGHTKGATSFTFDIIEDGRTHRVGIINMPTINAGVDLTGMPGYPEIADDYAATFASLRTMEFDIWLSSHAGHFAMHDKYQPGDPYRIDRFVDPAGFHAAVDRLEEKYRTQLASDRSAATSEV